MTKTFQQFLEQNDFCCEDYSGRGMYGQICLALTFGRESSLSELFANILNAVENMEDLEIVKNAIRGARTDSMGLGTVIYFPNIPFVGESENS